MKEFFQKYKKRFIVAALLLVAGVGIPIILNNTDPTINVLQYGARPDAVAASDGVVNGSTTFTSASITFTSADAGKLILIDSCMTGGGDLTTTIASVSSAHTIILTGTPTLSKTARTFYYGTDNTTPFKNAAVAASATQGITVLIPGGGSYLYQGGVNWTQPVRVRGSVSSREVIILDSAGSTSISQTQIINTNGTNVGFYLQGLSSTVENIDFTCAATHATAGNAITANAAQCSVQGCRFSGSWDGLVENYSVLWYSKDCVYGVINQGIFIQNLTNPDLGDFVIDNNWFSQQSVVPMAYGIKTLGSGGGKITNNKWNSFVGVGVSINVPSSGYSTSDLIFTGNSVENYTVRGLEILVSGGGAFYAPTIDNNQFYTPTTTAKAIYISGGATTGVWGGTIVGNNFRFPSSTDTCVYLKNATDIMVASNVMIQGNLSLYVDATCLRISQMGAMADLTGSLVFKSTGINSVFVNGSERSRYFANGNVVFSPTGSAMSDQGYPFQLISNQNSSFNNLIYNASAGAASAATLQFASGTSQGQIGIQSNGASVNPGALFITGPGALEMIYGKKVTMAINGASLQTTPPADFYIKDSTAGSGEFSLHNSSAATNADTRFSLRNDAGNFVYPAIFASSTYTPAYDTYLAANTLTFYTSNAAGSNIWVDANGPIHFLTGTAPASLRGTLLGTGEWLFGNQTATNSTGQVQIRSTGANGQLGLEYDATHYAQQTVGSNGDFTITPHAANLIASTGTAFFEQLGGGGWKYGSMVSNPSGPLWSFGFLTNGTTLSHTALAIDSFGVVTAQTNMFVNNSLTVTNNLTLNTAGSKFSMVEGTNGRVGQTTLVSGTKAITISGLTTSSRAFVTLVSPTGVTLTTQYQAVCTSNTLTIQANINSGTINVSDGSTLNYWIINSMNDWIALMLTLGLIRPLFKRKSLRESVLNQAA